MANTDLQTLRGEVRFRVVPDPTSTSLDGYIDTRINWTLENLAHILRVPEFESEQTIILTAGIRTENVPEDWIATLTVKDTTNDEIVEPLSARLEAKLDETETGPPRYFYRRNRTLIWFPAPGTSETGLTLRHRHLAKPARLTTDTSLSPLPSHYDEAIILGAAYRFFRDQNETERAARIYGEWVGLLHSMGDPRSTEMAHSSQGLVPAMPLRIL